MNRLWRVITVVNPVSSAFGSSKVADDQQSVVILLLGRMSYCLLLKLLGTDLTGY